MSASFVDTAAIWLVTFALHSTVALGLAWIVVASLRHRAQPTQEVLLRWSLWAPLVSTTLQVALVGSRWPLFAAAEVQPDLVAMLSPIGAPLAPPSALAPPADAIALRDAGESVATWSWQSIVVFAAAAMAGVGLAWLWRINARLHGLLLDRQPETDPRVLAFAARSARVLGLQQSPHLSRSHRIGTPIAFGWLRPEICLPQRVDQLAEGSLRAMLTHELAHLRRADPAWMWGAAWLQAVFPWQLLLLAARRRWAHLVELRCDAVAVAHAGPTAVARCLLDVAEWLRPQMPQPLGALGMASRPSALRERVEAALHGERVREPSVRVVHAMGGLAVGVLTISAPGLATSRADGAEPSAPAAVRAIDAPAPLDAMPPLEQLIQQLAEEQRAIAQEAAALRSELRAQPLTDEANRLQAAIAERLHHLETSRARLQLLLARRTSESR